MRAFQRRRGIFLGTVAAAVLSACGPLRRSAPPVFASSSDDSDTLTGTPAWIANPENYASLQRIHFRSDGTGRVVFGHGQTIYARIEFRFDLPATETLRLVYLDSPHRLNSDFSFFPTDANRTKTILFQVRSETTEGVINVVGSKFLYRRTLVFNESPYPVGLRLPYEEPRVFYGYPAN
jgi:hypothetical protein